MSNHHSFIDPMWCDYAEKRFYAGQFMLQLKAFFPQYENQLNELWNIFGKHINGLMYSYIEKVDLIPGSNYETINIKKFIQAETRNAMCEIIHECEKEERKAADIITRMNTVINPSQDYLEVIKRVTFYGNAQLVVEKQTNYALNLRFANS